jgi:hypothetical protein
MSNQSSGPTKVALPAIDIGPAQSAWSACCSDCEQKAFGRFAGVGNYIEHYNWAWEQYKTLYQGGPGTFGTDQDAWCAYVPFYYFDAQWGSRELTNRFMRCLSAKCLRHYQHLNVPGFRFSASVQNFVFATRAKYFNFPDTSGLSDAIITQVCFVDFFDPLHYLTPEHAPEWWGWRPPPP